MSLMELYNKIKNPIDDKEVIKLLIRVYAKKSKDIGGFYGKITKVVEKQHKGKYYPSEADEFHSMMFNKWKNSIIAVTDEEFMELYKNKSYDKDFIKMRNYLKKVADVKTKKEADEIFYNCKETDEELKEAIRKYRWTAFGEETAWTHVCSRDVTAKKDEYSKIEHRLYLNLESIDIYKVSTYFVKKCDEYKIPYYFKFDLWADRDDTFVVYSSTENLSKYIKILQEIKKEHSDLIYCKHQPPIFSGKIDDWIGYGSEPKKTDDQKTSFNLKRAKITELSIEKTIKKWIENKKDKLCIYNGEELRLEDFIILRASEIFITHLEKKFYTREEYYKNMKNYNKNIVSDELGYNITEINMPICKQKISEALKKYDLVDKLCNTESYKDIEDINMRVKNGKKIKFTSTIIEKVMEELALIIAKSDTDQFISDIQEQIKHDCLKNGIDSEKFCFDNDKRGKNHNGHD